MIRNFALGIGLISIFLFGAGMAQARAPEVTLNNLSAKLDQVIQTQQDIMQKLDELRSEINVVKIRASRV